MASALLFANACGGGGDKPTEPVVVTPTVTIGGGTPTLISGASVQLSAIVKDNHGQTVPGALVFWSTSNSNVANVSDNGLVTGVKTGNARITANSNGVTGTFDIVVEPGAAAVMVMRSSPSGANSGAPLAGQPVLELRDANGNVATSGSVSVTASLASGGGTLSGTTTVNSVNGVATFTNLAITGTVGLRILTFSSPGLASPVTSNIALQPGAPAALVLVTPPSGGGLNSPFTTQPVLHIVDAQSNVTTSTASVTASITQGSGTLTGATVNAANGVATFTTLGIQGADGPRTISFTSTAVSGGAPISTAVTPCDARPTLAFGIDSKSITGFVGGIARRDTIALNVSGGCSASAAFTVSAVSISGGNWLTVNTLPGNRIELVSTPGALAAGTYAASVRLNTATDFVPLPVQLIVRDGFPISYGTAQEKVTHLDVNGTANFAVTVRDTLDAVVVVPVGFFSRSPSIATVTSTGTITARVPGQAWIVSRVIEQGNRADSVLINVTSPTGPLVRLNIAQLTYSLGNTFTVTVVLDTRGANVGAGEVLFTWPSFDDNPGMFRRPTAPVSLGASAQITTNDATGTARISFVNAAGLTGIVPLASFTLRADRLGVGQLTTRFIELVGVDHSSLLDIANAVQYPIVVR